MSYSRVILRIFQGLFQELFQRFSKSSFKSYSETLFKNGFQAMCSDKNLSSWFRVSSYRVTSKDADFAMYIGFW